MTKPHKTPPALCPHCKRILSASTLCVSSAENTPPASGDYSVCSHCALPLIFREKLMACEILPEEIDAWDQSTAENILKIIYAAKKEIKARKSKQYFTPKAAWDIFVRDALVGVPITFIPDLKKSFYSGLLSLLPILISIQKDFPPAEHSQIYDDIFISVSKELGMKLVRKPIPERGDENDRRH